MARDVAAPWAEEVLVTAEDLAALSDEGRRYELVHGRLVRMPPTGLEHGALDLRLGAALLQYADEHELGLVTGAETGFMVSRPGQPDTVLAPDIAFIAADRVPARDSGAWKTFARLAPDLVVEIALPSQRRPEMEAKANLWLDTGVRLLWVIWPGSREVDVCNPKPAGRLRVLKGEDVLDGQDVLPRFTFPLARLWR